MPIRTGTSRSYGDACPIARALDAVGERWALLVVRELLLGPQRFSDLRRALPGVSTNILTDRLRELEEHGVVRRDRLPAPAASLVYELTERGRKLAPTLDALGSWGITLPPPSGQPWLSTTSVLLFLHGCLHRHPHPPGVYRIQLDERVWTIRTDGNEPQVHTGDPTSPDAGLHTDPQTLNSLLADSTSLDSATASAAATVTGNVNSLRGLLEAASEIARAVPTAAF